MRVSKPLLLRVSKAAAPRVDVPVFLSTLTPHQQALAHDLAVGNTTSEVAKKHGVTPGAISQFRVRFKTWFDAFFAEAS